MGGASKQASYARKVLGTTLWNVWRAKDGNLPALDVLHGALALEVGDAVEVEPRAAPPVMIAPTPDVEVAVVVSCDDDLDGVGQGLEPVELLLYVCGGAVVGEVSCVDEDVPRRHVDDLVVRVRDAHYAEGGLVPRRAERCAAQEQDEMVEVGGEVGEGREEQLVEHGELLPLALAAQAEPDQEAHGEVRRSTEARIVHRAPSTVHRASG